MFILLSGTGICGFGLVKGAKVCSSGVEFVTNKP